MTRKVTCPGSTTGSGAGLSHHPHPISHLGNSSISICITWAPVRGHKGHFQVPACGLRLILSDWCTPGLKGLVTPDTQPIFPSPASIATLSLEGLPSEPSHHQVSPFLGLDSACTQEPASTLHPQCTMKLVAFSQSSSPLSVTVGHSIFTPQFLCMQNGYGGKITYIKCPN